MHYIVGTRVCITPSTSSQGSGPRSVTAKPVRTLNRSTPFEPNEPYSLHNVLYNKDNSKFEYMFMNDSTQQMLKLEFDSTQEADRCISNARSEQLPDYQGFLKKRHN